MYEQYTDEQIVKMKAKEFEQYLNDFLQTLENHGGTVDFLFGAEMMANYAVNLLAIHEVVEDTFNEMAQS